MTFYLCEAGAIQIESFYRFNAIGFYDEDHIIEGMYLALTIHVKS